VAAGYELFINTYSLAEDDTTETIAEAAFLAGFTGRSRGNVRRRWRLTGEVGAGTELWRESLGGDIRWLDSLGNTRLRISGEGRGRQYRTDTAYGLSSDNLEGRLDVRGYPLATGRMKLESRAWMSGRDYRIPSTLELDRREVGGGLAVSGGRTVRRAWSLGARFFRRTYPDSSGINRDTVSMIGSWDNSGGGDSQVRIYHRTDRRTVADESARPSAWIHWTDLDFEQPVAAASLFLEMQNEVWRYDSVSQAYRNSWRTSGRLGCSWGDVLGTRWRAGFSGELLRNDDDTESYDQYGVLGGMETYGRRLTGSMLLEFGHRTYSASGDDELPLDPVSPGDGAFEAGPSDFNYWKIWLTANWSLTEHLALDLMASYEPENHGEKTDDTTLGFASVRLVWRP